MRPHQQRVVDEKIELDLKLVKLQAFFTTPIYGGIDPDERDRLKQQESAMARYSGVLGQRIAAFKDA